MRAGVIFIANLNIPKLRTKIHFQLFDNALKNINRKTAAPFGDLLRQCYPKNRPSCLLGGSKIVLYCRLLFAVNVQIRHYIGPYKKNSVCQTSILGKILHFSRVIWTFTDSEMSDLLVLSR